MRELVESEEGHFEVEKVEEVEETLELVEKKQDDGFEAGGRVGGTREYFEGDIGIKHKCNKLDKGWKNTKLPRRANYGQDYLKSKFSVGLRVVWAGGKNSLLDKTWPNGTVPVVLSNRSNSHSEGCH